MNERFWTFQDLLISTEVNNLMQFTIDFEL